MALASYDASFEPLNSIDDEFRIRFRTNEPNALLFYSKSQQNNDFFSVELRNGSIFVGIDLGSTVENRGETLTKCGSLLDDFQWHDVKVRRRSKEIMVVVDQIVSRNISISSFVSLNFDGKLYVGGAPSHIERGIEVRSNFYGCVENAIYRSYTQNRVIDILKGVRYRYQYYLAENGFLSYSCIDFGLYPVSFKDQASYLLMTRTQGSPRLDVSFAMRTFESEGLLYFHRFAKDASNRETGYVKMYLFETALYVKFQFGDKTAPEQYLVHRRHDLNDGLWHDVSFSISLDLMNVTVDFEPELVRGTFKIQTGDKFYIGGGLKDDLSLRGFVGCFRRLVLNDGTFVRADNVKTPDDATASSRDVISYGVAINSCDIFDKCTPNPCRHGGVCLQTWTEFRCDCSQTGYGGAVCHTSEHPLSCLDYKMTLMQQRYTYETERNLVIDVDGSGPIKPFNVACLFGSQNENMNITSVSHYNEEEVIVKGYRAPGSYSQNIMYSATKEQINELVERAYSCSQYVSIKCRGARFLNYKGDPYGWWTGRTNQPMYYWGGGEVGIRKCKCGINQDCDYPNQFCNCDAGDVTVEREDSGVLRNKIYLPVYRVNFGDTGEVSENRYIKYSIGKLVCEGDRLYDNVVTFRKTDATLLAPRFESSIAGDIRFQFRTASDSGIFIQNIGNVTGDLLEVKLQTPRIIAFRYSAGGGTKVISISSAFDFNDNAWHTVQIERNRREARLTIDSISAANPEDQQSFRPFLFTSNLTVGASVDYHDGFVGCMRGLQVNGEIINLVERAKREIYGVSVGCVGKCSSNPCLNGGTCLEHWSYYKCDCTFTPFRGLICGTEIGVQLEAGNIIKYTFPTKGLTGTEEETINAQFATYSKQGIIMQVKSDKVDEKGMTDYFTLEMNNNGGVRVRFNYGFDNFEYNPPFDLSNGQNHEVIIRRTNRGQSIFIQVDEHPPYEFNFTRGSYIDMVFDAQHVLYVGRNESMRPDMGFVGCISRLQFNRIFPLKYAFLEVPDPNMYVNGTNIREWYCNIDPVTHAPDAIEIPPDRDIKIIKLPNMNLPPLEDWRYATILGVCLAIFLASAIGIVIFLYHRYAYKGTYVTKEDKGATHAIDADEAITKGDSRHPNVIERKEWFL